MAIPISIQLYTLRDMVAKDGYMAVLKAVAEIGFPYVEMAGLYGKSAGEIRATLDGLNLKAMGAHINFTDPKGWQQAEDEAKALGYKHLITSIGNAEFETPEKIRAVAEKINAAINHFAPKGYTLSLHNHWWEFNGPNRCDLLLELCPRAHLQADVYWLQTGGADPAEIIKRYGTRTKLLHIKDGPADGKDTGLPMTAVGEGKVNIPECVRAAEYAGAEYLSIELDRCATDMLTAVRESYNYMTRRGLAKGNR